MAFRDSMRRGLEAFADSFIAARRPNKLLDLAAEAAHKYLRRYENINHHIATNGEASLLQRMSKCGLTTFVDVGANRGEWTQAVLCVFPAATVCSLEILPSTYKLLEESIGNEPRVKLFNLGLADRAGLVEVNSYLENDLLSGLRSRYSPDLKCEVVRAAVVSGDQFLVEQGIQEVDFIKIDVEGAEPLVLRGLEKTIARKNVSVIQVEHGHSEWRLDDCRRFFTDNGFRFGKVFPRYCDFSTGYSEFRQAVVSNYVAVRADRLDLLEAAAGALALADPARPGS